MKSDVVKYIDELEGLATGNCEEELKAVWPSLCQKAGIAEFSMPPVAEVSRMWKFLAKAIKSAEPARNFANAKIQAARWPTALFAHLPYGGNANSKGKEWLTDKLASCGLF